MTDIPTPRMLRKLLRYDFATGLLYWRERPVDMFSERKRSAEHVCNQWNSRYAGEEAFTAESGDGYRCGSIFDRMYKAHRVIFAMQTGAWPIDQLDHIDGVRDNNRIENLREVTRFENMRNTKRPVTNTSGHVGVSWHKAREKWRAHIYAGGAQQSLGYFVTRADAVAARAAAEVEYGYHKNHGREI